MRIKNGTKYEKAVMRAVALCYKPYLKPEEAMIYCNLGRTQLTKKLEQYLIFKNDNGCYKRKDLDRILQGLPSPVTEKANQLKLRFQKK